MGKGDRKRGKPPKLAREAACPVSGVAIAISEGRPAQGRKRQRELEREAMTPTLERRCRVMGWFAIKHGAPVYSDDDMERARDERLGNPGGRLLIAGHLHEDQYLGLCDFRDAMMEWAAAFEVPWPYPRGCAWAREARGGQSVTPDDRTGPGRKADAWNAMRDAERVLDSAMACVVNDLMADGMDDWSPSQAPDWWIQQAQLASAALARHFKRRL